MIPKFPDFKKLDLSDRDDIEKFTSQYDPYSDFNFAEMWAWDLDGQFEFCELNGNLIIVPNYYYDNSYSLSYLGNNNLEDTLAKLFDFMKSKKLGELKLRLVPEVSLSGIDLNKYFIEIDIDNCDYVYDLKRLSNYEGTGYNKKRLTLNHFLRNYADCKIVEIDLNNPVNQQEINELTKTWVKNKLKNNNGFDSNKELIALKRFLESEQNNVLCVGVTHSDKLIGYMIFSLLNNKYVMCHFAKGDVSFYGIYEYLMKHSAEILVRKGYEFMNHQEDLGIPGLRFSKSSYKPVSFLRTYAIREL